MCQLGLSLWPLSDLVKLEDSSYFDPRHVAAEISVVQFAAQLTHLEFGSFL